MNKWTWLIVILFLIWTAFSWKWYVCGIKGFCDHKAEMMVEDADISISEIDEEIEERPVTQVNTPSTNRTTVSTTETQRVVECSSYLKQHIKYGNNHSATEVAKLERFLNEFEGEDLSENGVYELVDVAAVERFQQKYKAQVLDPWGLTEPTGYVFETTRDQINRIYCANTAARN